MPTRRNLLKIGLAAAATTAISPPGSALSAAAKHRIEGDGEPVLLIAGFSCDLSVWDIAAPLIAKKGFRVIRFNNLGVGRDVQFSPAGITIPAMTRHVVDLLAELDLASAHVVGHSMGGQIAQELALAEPQRVASLTLLSSWAQPSARLCALLTELANLSGKIPPAEWQRNFLPWLLTDAAYVVPGLIDQASQGYAENPDRLPPALLQAQASAIAASDASKRLSELKMPTLVAVGGQDILTPPALSRELHESIPNSAFELLPAGHGNIAEAAAELSARVAVFLRSNPLR
jgi:pimeloyl-ACP methyl ester carboxylesterase